MEEGGQIWQYIQKLGMEYAQKKPKRHEFIHLSKKEATKKVSKMEPYL